MDNAVKSSQRLVWMDVLRGLLILFVVIGHATGAYNKYIYQFHMGAFFLVSGYMSQPERRTVAHTLYHRFLTVYLPVLSATVLLGAASVILHRTGLYSVFLGDSPYLGFFATLKEFLLYGNQYVWWLGACWFMLALFGASVVNRILLRLCEDQYDRWFLLASTVLFLAGYRLADTGGARYSFDLVLIAQFYFTLGTFLRNRRPMAPENLSAARSLLGIVITGCLLWLSAEVLKATVDYPDRRFQNPITDTLIALNGAAFTYFLAALMCRFSLTRHILAAAGRNTLPVVLFHFLWFNLGYAILYILGRAPFEYLRSFTPGELGAPWWPMFTLIGIVMSILTWKIMMRLRILRVLFGQEKQIYDQCWNRLRGISIPDFFR